MSDSSTPSEASDPQASAVASSAPAEAPASTELDLRERSEASALASELTPPQQQVLQQLALGAGIIQASEATGVSRRSISRWVNEDPKFVAAFNAWKREQLESGRASALAMTDVAMSTIRGGIEKGDVGVAFRMVKELGILGDAKPGLTDAEQLRRRRAVRRVRREKKLREIEVKHGLRLEEKLEKDGIAWTYDGEGILDYEERQMLYFLREKMSRRTSDTYAGFSPLDAGRPLSRWERNLLFKAREETLRTGKFTFRRGEPVQLHAECYGRGPRSKRQMFDILVEDGMDKDEALRLLSKYPKPYPEFYYPNDLPYEEDLDPAEQPAAGSSSDPAAAQATPEQASPGNATAPDAGPTPANG